MLTLNKYLLGIADETINYIVALLQYHHYYTVTPATPTRNFYSPAAPENLTTNIRIEELIADNAAAAATATVTISETITVGPEYMTTLAPYEILSDTPLISLSIAISMNHYHLTFHWRSLYKIHHMHQVNIPVTRPQV